MEKAGTASRDVDGLKGELQQQSSVQRTTQDQVGVIGARISAIETSVTGDSLKVSLTPVRGPIEAGVAGIIDESFAGRATYCPGDHHYDPTVKTLAVAVGLANNGTLRCGARVRIKRTLDDGGTLSIDTEVSDQFPDASDDLTAPTARKFNLSRAAADALQVDGVAVVTVELIESVK